MEFSAQLIRPTGCAVLGEEAREYADAMRGSNAEFLWSEDAGLSQVSGIDGGSGPVLFDPLGGIIDAELTVQLLRDYVCPCDERIVKITRRGSGKISLKSMEEKTWEVERVVVATGVDSPYLVATFDMPIPRPIYRHVRFNLQPVGALAGLDCCFLDRRRRLPLRWSFYGLKLDDETIAIGAGWSEAPFAAKLWEPSQVKERSELQIRSWLDLHGEDSATIVGALECVHPRVQLRNGLPYEIVNREGILTVRGNDLFKFAPVIACDVCDLLHVDIMESQ